MKKIIYIISFIILMIYSFLMVSCSTTRDIEYITKYDTVRIENKIIEKDTLLFKDSIYHYEKGDTLIIREKSYVYNNNINKIINDTVKIKENTVYKDKIITKTSWKDKLFPYLLALAVINTLYLLWKGIRKRFDSIL